MNNHHLISCIRLHYKTPTRPIKAIIWKLLNYHKNVKPIIGQTVPHSYSASADSSRPIKKKERMEKLKINPFYEKYAIKFDQLKQNQPKEFEERVAKLVKPGTKDGRNEVKTSEENGGDHAKCGDTYDDKDTKSFKRERKMVLSNVIKIDMLRDKTGDEISKIWTDYHKHKQMVSATLHAEAFHHTFATSKEYPTFLYVLPRGDGYEFIMSQFADTSCYFTPLILFQRHAENAPPCLTLHFYDDLLEEKGIVLMRGEMDKDVINSLEAQCLANQLQLYYSQDDEERRRLLRTFSENPEKFNYLDVIKQIERLDLTPSPTSP